MDDLKQLSPTQEKIIDKTIENVTRKLVAGYRNKNNVPSKGSSPSAKESLKNTVKASSAQSAMDVANRGSMWKEMISKSFSHGISSLSTLQFDNEFTVKEGVATGLGSIPNGPGVYVVYDEQGSVRYIGDAKNVQKRWTAGHLNENRQKERAGEEYKLNKELTEGCVVKVIQCDSKETAAALEASLIEEARTSDEYDVVNAKEELKSEQGSRSNIEAKKIKDKLGSAAELAGGAAAEAIKHGGWIMMEQAIAECVQALKAEIVDFFLSGKHEFIERLKRLLRKVLSVIRKQLSNVLDMAKGVFEFIVNAFSQAISQVYQLAKNIYELGAAAWSLYRNRKTMTKEELILKVTETIVISGNVALWSSIDLAIEAQLTPLIGPFSPFLAAFVSAFGFGVTSQYLSEFVPKIIDLIIGGYTETKENLEQSAELIIQTSQMNIKLIDSLDEYIKSSLLLVDEIAWHTEKLTVLSDRKFSVREEIKF